ncbi:hypothetical protein TNCV_1948111 [Trichonephila clavipes]|nr:hypothetical protein TNCV_1948111 [Trichonephila clavipes]
MGCNAEGCGFQMLNDDEIVTSVQKESDPVDDEMDEGEDNNNNENSKDASNVDAFSALETAGECYPNGVHSQLIRINDVLHFMGLVDESYCCNAIIDRTVIAKLLSCSLLPNLVVSEAADV